MTKWLLIRGLSRQQKHWGHFVSKLAHATGSEVLCLDLPGFGLQADTPSPASIAAIAQQLLPTVFSEQNLIDGKINIIGLSLGGMVAYELSKRCPEKVDRLVLINSSFRPFSRFYERLRPRSYAKVLKAFLHRDHRKSEQAILSMSSNQFADDSALLDRWTQYRSEFPPSRASVVKQLIAAANYRVDKHKPVSNMLLIAAKKDRIVSYRCTQNMAYVWQCDLRLHEYGGHDLSVDAPEWLAHTISEWASEPTRQDL